MKNWEKYKEDIEKIGTLLFGLRKDGSIDGCHKIDCSDCQFFSGSGCRKNTISWLYEEYEEPKPKLTKEEFILLNSLQYPMDLMIRRNGEGDVYLGTHFIGVGLKKDMFSFILPGQGYEVMELKELEIEEGE